jgi:tetratricopeptide (TPR) repeat protein
MLRIILLTIAVTFLGAWQTPLAASELLEPTVTCVPEATPAEVGDNEKYYAFTSPAETIYNRVMSLDLDGAQTDIDAFRSKFPTNLVAEHLESYLDFFRLYLKGDERLDDRLSARFDRRINALDQGDENSPYYRFALAEARLHRSLIHLRFERHLAAFRELNKANKLLRDNAKLFPDFLLTYKDLGLLHAAVGSIPPQYKWGVELFSSLNGTIPEGRAEMELALADRDSPFLLETEVLFAFLELHLAGQQEAAYQKIKGLGLTPKTNALHCFILANLAMRSGRNEVALGILEEQPRGGRVADFPYLDFMLGLAKLRTLDPRARIHFQSFSVRYSGRHFKEEAQQKIAWAYWLEGDDAGYRRAMERIGGGSQAGGDQNAAREAARQRPPHSALLRARLLFDGNYCTRARATLEAIDQETLTDQEHLEYLYRTGRVLDGLADYDGAISFYLRTVQVGRKNPAFFACKSALQAGLIEEKRGQNTQAKQYFNTCLSISPAEYKTGLHLLAKAGLNRVK